MEERSKSNKRDKQLQTDTKMLELLKEYYTEKFHTQIQEEDINRENGWEITREKVEGALHKVKARREIGEEEIVSEIIQ